MTAQRFWWEGWTPVLIACAVGIILDILAWLIYFGPVWP